MNRNNNFIIETIKKDLKIALSYKVRFFFTIFGIFISLVSFFLFSNFIGQDNNPHIEKYGGLYFDFAVIGYVSGQMTYVLVSTLNTEIRNMQLSGIFEYYILSGKNEIIVLISTLIYPSLFLLMRQFIFIFLAIYIFKSQIELTNIGLIGFTSTLLFIVCLLGVGMISAASMILFKTGNFITSTYLGLTAMLSGVAIPVSVLPSFMQFFSNFLPNTHYLEIIRIDLQGINDQSMIFFGSNFYSLTVFALCLFSIGLLILNRSILKAKKDGILANY